MDDCMDLMDPRKQDEIHPKVKQLWKRDNNHMLRETGSTLEPISMFDLFHVPVTKDCFNASKFKIALAAAIKCTVYQKDPDFHLLLNFDINKREAAFRHFVNGDFETGVSVLIDGAGTQSFTHLLNNIRDEATDYAKIIFGYHYRVATIKHAKGHKPRTSRMVQHI